MAQAENTGNMPRSATTQGDQAVVAVLAGAASWVHADSLRPWDRNPRRNDPAVPRVAESIRRWGFVSPIVVWRAADRMVAGHTRLRAMQQLLAADPAFTAKGAPGPGMVRVVFHDFETEHDADLYALADNRLQELASWDDDLLREALQDATAEDRLVAGWNADEYTELLSGNDDEVQPDTGVAGSLQARFVVPPFTVLDARQGYWQERKRAWIGLGLRSEEGRDGLGSTVASASLASEAYGGPRGGTEGGSIFDPVLTELLVRWFSPPTGTVLDPFAGGSVRGVVTAALGRTYVGLELRQKQVEANRAQWAMLAPKLRSAGAAPASVPAQPEPCPDYTPDLTPVEQHGDVWLKRDDLFAVAGVRGGKVRSCWHLAQQAKAAGAAGIITAGSRSSPQVNIVAHVAARLGLRCRVHTPEEQPSPEVAQAVKLGAELVQHRAGYNNVIIARAREDAQALGWPEIPFGMECQAAVDATRAQVANLPAGAKRLVVPVGSGMSLAGILHGLRDAGRTLPVLGVVVGADPAKRLNKYAPKGWRDMVQLVPAGVDYHEEVTASVGTVVLDPVYEAKCARHLQPGDVLWCVGIRATATAPTPPPATLGLAAELVDPRWVQGDSNETLDGDGPPGQADFLLTCPPYADLEVYSDDPADISGMPYGQFLAVYRSILAKAAARLRPGRFAAIVVGDVRAPDGTYRNFVSHTIQAMLDAGLALYNEAILVTPLGTVPVRAAKTMEASRKLGKTHQNVLIFVKGDAKAATQAVGPVQFELPEDD